MSAISEETIREFSKATGNAVHETFVVEAREAIYAPMPYGFTDKFYSDILKGLGVVTEGAARIWRHQAEALEAISSGLNAVLSTGTASGKSLIFQLASIFKIKQYHDKATAVAFYNTRALNNDQELSWKTIMEKAGYPPESLAVINGDVNVDDRLKRLENAKVVLATPDIFHSWMLSNLDKEPVRRFISRLVLKTFDEGQNLEGLFGTKVAYLNLRLEFAQRMLNKNFRDGDHNQTIIASATLEDPQRFARQLTGQDFWVIDEQQNAAPRKKRSFTVFSTPVGKRQWALTQALISLAQKRHVGSILAFINSRPRVDEVTRMANAALKKNQFAAYRGGQEAGDRVKTEEDLRTGSLTGAVTTNALLSGVNIQTVSTVIMEGVPDNPSDLIQGGGRVRGEGNVWIFEEARLLKRMMQTVQQMFEGSPHRAIFYKSHTKVLAETAVCLIEEMKQLGANYDDLVNSGVKFPKNLLKNVKDYLEKSYEDLTDSQRAAIPPDDETAQYFHTLRSVDGRAKRMLAFSPKLERFAHVGEVTQIQFLREALPGMVVLLSRRLYRVKSSRDAVGSPVMLKALAKEEYANAPQTRAMIQATIHTSLHDQCVSLYRNQSGAKRHALRMRDMHNFIADCNLTLEQVAEGYVERRGKTFTRIYYDTSVKEPEVHRTGKNSCRIRTQEHGGPRKAIVQTTGVVIRMGDPVLSNKELRRLAMLLRRALCDEFDVSPADVGFSVNTATVGVTARTRTKDRTIVIFDRTPGSLNLTAKIFHNMDAMYGRMMSLIDSNDREMWSILERFMDWQDKSKMKPMQAPNYEKWSLDGAAKPKNSTIAYLPGSEVYWQKNGQQRWVEILGADFIQGEFMYKIKDLGVDRNPYRSVAERSHVKKMEETNSCRYVRPQEITRPENPSYRLGYFDLSNGVYHEDKSKMMVIDRSSTKPIARPRRFGFERVI